jgi:hypothetical protein
MSAIRSKDRASLCLFSFADNRRCRLPRSPAHPHLCVFHARKEAQTLTAEQVGRDIAASFGNGYISACDLTTALTRLFSAAAQGQIKTKAASTLGYLAQTLLQSIHLAQHEYINAFGTDSWRRVIRNSFAEPSPPPPPPVIDPEPESQGPAPISSSPVAYKPEPSRPTSTPLQPMTPRAAVPPPSAKSTNPRPQAIPAQCNKLSGINTCKTLSKQTTLTPFRMNTCEKSKEGQSDSV